MLPRTRRAWASGLGVEADEGAEVSDGLADEAGDRASDEGAVLAVDGGWVGWDVVWSQRPKSCRLPAGWLWTYCSQLDIKGIMDIIKAVLLQVTEK